MMERVRAGHPQCPPKMETDLSNKKTILVFVIVGGCFAVLWPNVFYPMIMGTVSQQIKPSPIDRTTGCCDVISEIDVNTIKIMSELCGSIIRTKDGASRALPAKEIVQMCRREVLHTCGIDISVVLQDHVRLGQNVKQILDEIRSLNGSLCLKYNYGVAPWRLGVPHRVTVKMSPSTNIRQERPLHLRSELIHPAFRERGRAIPQPHVATPSRPAPRVIEGRPGPVPGMRPTIGGAGHVVPPAKQGTSSMSIIMPIYTIGIVIFFTYTLMKILFKKQPDGGGLYPPVEPDPHFRREVFEAERARMAARVTRDSISGKIGDAELDQLRQRLRETEMAMERIVEQMAKVPLKSQANGGLSNGSAPKVPDEQPRVTVLGMEMTASCEGGKKWPRPESPIVPPSVPAAPAVPPPQEIYLEGALPAQSHLLVADSATEAQPNRGESPAVVLAGKMTLSVISLDSSETDTDNGSATEYAKQVDEYRIAGSHLSEQNDDTSTGNKSIFRKEDEDEYGTETIEDISIPPTNLEDNSDQQHEIVKVIENILEKSEIDIITIENIADETKQDEPEAKSITDFSTDSIEEKSDSDVENLDEPNEKKMSIIKQMENLIDEVAPVREDIEETEKEINLTSQLDDITEKIEQQTANAALLERLEQRIEEQKVLLDEADFIETKKDTSEHPDEEEQGEEEEEEEPERRIEGIGDEDELEEVEVETDDEDLDDGEEIEIEEILYESDEDSDDEIAENELRTQPSEGRLNGNDDFEESKHTTVASETAAEISDDEINDTEEEIEDEEIDSNHVPEVSED